MKAALLLPCLILSLCIASAQDPEYSFQEKYDISTPAQLGISCSDGDIEVVPSDGNEIRVLYIAKKYNKVLSVTRKELEEDFIIEVIHDKNRLKIIVRYRDPHRWSWTGRDQINVGFRVTVPKQTACELHTSDGNILLSGLTSDQEVKTSDGNITISNVTGTVVGGTSDGNIDLKNIRGPVDLGTSDGDVRLDNITGNVEARTSDGTISLATLKGDVLVKTSDGDINFRDISGSLTGTTSDGNVRGNIVDLKKLDIRTTDGNITITIPDRLGLDLDIKGESLNVPLNNFTGKSDDKFIRGKTNGGGIAVSLHTSDGNVRLNYQ